MPKKDKRPTRIYPDNRQKPAVTESSAKAPTPSPAPPTPPHQ